MDMKSIGIGIGAGLASALLIASLVSGSSFSFVLVSLSPLPLLIAGFGWGFAAALIGGVIASIALGAATNLAFGTMFLFAIAGPAAALSLVTLLARPAEESEDADVRAAGGTEWFPIGNIVEALAGMSVLLAVLFVLQFGFSFDSFVEAVRPSIEATMELFRLTYGQTGALPARNSEEYLVAVRRMAQLLPLSLVSFVFLMLLLNTWLAGKVVVRSGRTARPWPDLASLALPRRDLFILLIAVVVALFSSGLLATFAGAVAIAFVFAFLWQGFAIMHFVTRGRPARTLILVFVYFSIVILSLPAIVLILVGMLDSLFNFRKRFAAPPKAPSPFG